MTKKKLKKRIPQEGVREPEVNRLTLYMTWAILALGCFVLFLPLAVDYDFYYPYIFLKSILFRTAVQAMAFLYIILALVSPDHRPRFHRITYALMAYFGVMLICSLPGISIDSWNSWWGDFRRMGGMFTQLHLLAYFFVLTQTLKQERHWLTLFTASLLFGVFMGLTGLIHYSGLNFTFRFNLADPRIGGATGNPVFFAFYMLLNFFMAFYLIARKDRRQIFPFIAKTWLILLIAMDVFLVAWDAASGGWILSAGLTLLPLGVFVFSLHGATLCWFAMRRKAWAGAVFLGALALYYLFWMIQSHTRATAVGLASSLSLMSILYIWKGPDKRLKWAAAFMILLFAGLLFTLIGYGHSEWVRNSPIMSRLASTSFEENRVMAWKAGISAFLDRPVLGWGLEHYHNAFDVHAPAQLFSGPVIENWYDRAHNFIVDIGTTTGLSGLAAYLIFYALAFSFLLRRWFRTREASDSILIAGLLLAYLLQNLFTFDSVNTDGILFLVLAYVAHLYGQAESGPAAAAHARNSPPLLISWKSWSVLAFAGALLGCSYIYLVKHPYDANLLLNLGIAMEKTSGPRPDTSRYVFREGILETFQQAEAYGTAGRYQVREEFADYASALALADYIPLNEKTRAARKAAAFLEKSIYEDPRDVRHRMYLATLINSTFPVLKQSDPNLAVSLAEKSLYFLKKAEVLSPNRSRLFLERAQLHLSLGRIVEAIPDLQRAVLLEPKTMQPRLVLVRAYISDGRYRDAEIEWQRIKALDPPPTAVDCQAVIVLYESRKQFASVAALCKELLQKSPDDPFLLAHLAGAYRELGDMNAARQTALKAAALSPQLAAQLQDFLRTLEKKAATD
jgi:tetratricopeptide (TPR) repeat protein